MERRSHFAFISRTPEIAITEDTEKAYTQSMIINIMDWLVLLPRMKEYGVIFPIGGVTDVVDVGGGGAGGGVGDL
jgi:hypothetical protein